MSPLDPGRWSDETIVITGGSQGIGLALATELAGRCRMLTLIARDTDRLRLDPLIGRGLKWVVKAKCPVVVGEWDFSKITFGHDEGHLVDATISQSTRSVGDL